MHVGALKEHFYEIQLLSGLLLLKFARFYFYGWVKKQEFQQTVIYLKS